MAGYPANKLSQDDYTKLFRKWQGIQLISYLRMIILKPFGQLIKLDKEMMVRKKTLNDFNKNSKLF